MTPPNKNLTIAVLAIALALVIGWLASSSYERTGLPSPTPPSPEAAVTPPAAPAPSPIPVSPAAKQPPAAPAPSKLGYTLTSLITILRPIQGEVWLRNHNARIKWEQPQGSRGVSISVVTVGGIVYRIKDGLTGTNVDYEWLIGNLPGGKILSDGQYYVLLCYTSTTSCTRTNFLVTLKTNPYP